MGVCIQEGWAETPPELGKWTVRILLECFLVARNSAFSMAHVPRLIKDNLLNETIIFNIYICLTSLTRAKPKDKMEFPA